MVLSAARCVVCDIAACFACECVFVANSSLNVNYWPGNRDGEKMRGNGWKVNGAFRNLPKHLQCVHI